MAYQIVPFPMTSGSKLGTHKHKI